MEFPPDGDGAEPRSAPLDEVVLTDVLDGSGAGALPRLRLLVVSGPDRGRELPLVRGSYLVGKDPDCALVLSDAAVSRRHLELAVLPAGLRVRDLGSRNGSSFQGARFSEITIGPGAVIRAGRNELRLVPDGVREALPPSTHDRFGDLFGGSLVMRELYAVLERVADAEVAVLIEGETGTGKEVCAEAIHAASRRAGGPFAICDLAGISRSLIEAELFGHVRGSFTGADRDREGAFVQASSGTLFIDEVGEMDLELQPRLLRALERRQVKPVGSSNYRAVDVRVVAATNRDLAAEVRAGRFRDDLYHRLAVVRVRLPSLRERKEDIPQLVDHLLARAAPPSAEAAGGSPVGAAATAGPAAIVPPETMALLVSHDWPGNVRELKNVLDRGLSLLRRPVASAAPSDAGAASPVEPSPEPAVLTPELLGLSAAPAPLAPPPVRFHEAKENLVTAWERDYLGALLARSGGNVSRAAREAGMDRVYLHRLLKKHGLHGGGSRPE
jgi:DNA-binding NtrC family response regulator